MTFPISNLPQTTQSLVDAGRWDEAISTLASSYEASQAEERLFQLRDLRVKAGLDTLSKPHSLPSNPCPPLCEDPFPSTLGKIPEIDCKNLEIDKLAGAIRHHGALIVRNMVSTEFSEQTRNHIDKVMSDAGDYFNRYMKASPRLRRQQARTNTDIRDSSIWFLPFPKMHQQVDPKTIHMMLLTGAVWTFLSPKVAYEIMSCFSRLGLKDLLTQYFEEQPCVSFLKSTLRRVEPLENPSDWHQDGAFMGSNIKSINLWIALTDCGEGTSSPGMEIVPKRLDDVLPGGKKWSGIRLVCVSQICPRMVQGLPAGAATF